MQKMDINSLRAILAEEIGKLRNGETTPANVNAITNATGKILSTVKLEMEYHKILGKTPRIDFIKVRDKKMIEDGGKEDSHATTAPAKIRKLGNGSANKS